mmetsp:Transcript_4572/g.13150  ORF Transcript_4572/g.13150 Transcript_4572/m.13150 type:complete len:230 (-) Transcript_4572:2850-3539(-)|eukprot:CAMPEP_0206137232 /NCGR_PEP_ID=MMETSP1473-20131121/2391_1 /ASSEMBLY_ACC=CAM_ASM_001109 /TAXON_ID=1461547 /ORGANISM="Stichococcus sp, Strain RCC1054" /LENGTH=229 /DNA_ID=CAMNT_0053530221 /DNA_START=270 /DNA_END=959 /DNA_ORIENTATION=-
MPEEESRVAGAIEGAGKPTSGGAGVVQARAPIPKLVAELLWAQWWELGPYANAVMMWASMPYAFSGVSPMGAKQVIAAVDLGRPQTIAVAKMTAVMVKLNMANMVAGITAAVADERPDSVAKVSIELMLMNEMEVLTIVTNTMVANGNMTQAAVIAKAMGEHGHGEFLKMVATENLPESLQKVKGAFDGAVGAVAGMLPGSGGADDNASEGSVADEVMAAQGKQKTAKE